MKQEQALQDLIAYYEEKNKANPDEDNMLKILGLDEPKMENILKTTFTEVMSSRDNGGDIAVVIQVMKKCDTLVEALIAVLAFERTMGQFNNNPLAKLLNDM